ncbi:MAG: YjbH domain-containing protein [Deltaproteobacteria bacterium]|nr:YjbH domain-containing protein [Deltaproteobacteria bacterium]
MKGEYCYGRFFAVFTLLLSLSFGVSILLSPSYIKADDSPFISPTNRGDTGLIEIPSARVLKKETYRIGASQAEPYRHYYGVISPFKGLEIGGRITEVLGVEAFEDLGTFGNTRDKAADIKYQFMPEGRYLPSVALGIMDPSGTRIYPSQYVVASKQIYPFDFTIGLGNGRFGRRPLPSTGEGFGLEIFEEPKKWFDDALLFGGVQFAPSEKYAFMVEYSPIRYHVQTTDPAQSKYFREPVHSRYNFGLRYRPKKWSEITLSYQRGNRIGVNLSFTFNIGKPLLPIYDPPYKEVRADSFTPLPERLTKALHASGFSDIAVMEESDNLWIEAQNEKYFHDARALRVIMGIVNRLAQPDINRVHIILKEKGIPSFEFTTTREDIYEMEERRLTSSELLYLSTMNPSVTETIDRPAKHTMALRYGMVPSFKTFLNDPSGFFKYRLGLAGWISYQPWRGVTVMTALEGYPLNTVTTTNQPLSIPVRSDIALYKRERVVVGRLMYDQILKMGHEVYGRVAGGLLEVQYAGFDGEIAKPLWNGTVIIGMRGSLVKKRDSGNPLKLQENAAKDLFSTAFLMTRFNIRKHEISIDLKSGQFLAGDVGTRITVSKRIRGVTVSAWYSFTDTSVFHDEHNRGYHDKGIAVVIPLRIFKGSDTKTVYTYALSPWTRDVAQDVDSYNPLLDFINKNRDVYFDKDKQIVYK